MHACIVATKLRMLVPHQCYWHTHRSGSVFFFDPLAVDNKFYYFHIYTLLSSIRRENLQSGCVLACVLFPGENQLDRFRIDCASGARTFLKVVDRLICSRTQYWVRGVFRCRLMHCYTVGFSLLRHSL